jgi:hypothetical protein
MGPTDADRSDLGLSPLPERVLQLLAAENASPLVARLTLAHDVAGRLVRRMHKKWPRLVFVVDHARSRHRHLERPHSSSRGLRGEPAGEALRWNGSGNSKVRSDRL